MTRWALPVGVAVLFLLAGAGVERAAAGHVPWSPTAVRVVVSPSPYPVVSVSPSPYPAPYAVPGPVRTVLVPGPAFDCTLFARGFANRIYLASQSMTVAESLQLSQELEQQCRLDGGE